MSYRPPFDDPRVVDVVRRRGLLDANESLLDGITRVASTLAAHDRQLGGSAEFATELNEALLTGRIAVSSQLFAAAGRSSNVAACTVLPAAGSTDEQRALRAIAAAAAASAAGMGCGLDLSDFDDPAAAARAVNEAIRSVHVQLTQQGQRPPALMLTCAGAHPQVEDFISVKRGADFSTWVANISIRVGDGDEEWARLRQHLAEAAHHNGEPGILFQGAADADNPTPQIELTSTAPCAEVFLSAGERCVFVSVNLAAHVTQAGFDETAFGRSVRLAVRTADAAVELAAANAAPVVAARRRIGIGVCGYHSALIRLCQPYGTSAAFAARISELLTFHAHRASAGLAAERGAFPMFAESRWRDARWLRRKARHRVGAIDAEAWQALEAEILTAGIRNAAIVAYPPTGVVAEMLGVSRSYEPHFTLAGQTGVASSFALHVVPEVEEALAQMTGGGAMRDQILSPVTDHQLPGAREGDLLACARQLSPEVHLAVHAAFSGFADEAGSKTVNLSAEATVEQVATLLDEARALGLKGLTVFRDGCLSTEGAAA